MLENYESLLKGLNEKCKYKIDYELCDVNSLGKTLYQMMTL